MVLAVPWTRPLLAATSSALAAAVVAHNGGGAVPLWLVSALGVATVATFGSGLAFMGSGLFGRPILGADPASSAGRLALTFDDGPHPVHTRAVLDLLEARGHRATFFVIGTRGARHPELLAEIVRRGHALGNHSHAHSWATAALSVRRLVADLQRAQATLRAAGWIHGGSGRRSASSRRASTRRRAAPGCASSDGRRRPATACATHPARALRRLLRGVRPGAILALHDAAEHGDREPVALRVLPRLLDELDSRKLRSVTIDELLGSGRPRAGPDPIVPPAAAVLTP